MQINEITNPGNFCGAGYCSRGSLRVCDHVISVSAGSSSSWTRTRTGPSSRTSTRGSGTRRTPASDWYVTTVSISRCFRRRTWTRPTRYSSWRRGTSSTSSPKWWTSTDTCCWRRAWWVCWLRFCGALLEMWSGFELEDVPWRWIWFSIWNQFQILKLLMYLQISKNSRERCGDNRLGKSLR